MEKQKSQSGYTLIEAIMFIGVIAMLAIAVINLINSMLDKYRISRVTQQIVDLQKNIDFRFSAAENFGDLESKLLTGESIVPGDMVGGNKIYHAYKGEVTIKSAQQDSVYEVTFKDLPYNACTELAMIDWMTGYNSHLVHIKVNSKYFTWQGKNDQAADGIRQCHHRLSGQPQQRHNLAVSVGLRHAVKNWVQSDFLLEENC